MQSVHARPQSIAEFPISSPTALETFGVTGCACRTEAYSVSRFARVTDSVNNGQLQHSRQPVARYAA